ncbi:ABC transporter permease [Winogradskyella undariae]|uniref:ABC transporter permease n=1 Tax=Winogradskyella undariae TaxID=1285465 RepID=UPI00156ADF43|nr:ABC transporter permease [Winogradskyella undariae]NRR92791.1 ABC transporter permease [Winogradskyella undariae]
MGAIKKLFKLKSNDISKPLTENTEQAREQIRITYYQSGYGASTKASGNAVTFGVGLQNLYNTFENLCRKQLNEQEILKQPYKEAQEKERTELKKRETALTIYEEQKNSLITDIDKSKSEMIDVRQNPERYGIDVDKRPNAQFYIGLLLLIPITIYLFVFYISASYSAFFKDFETGSLTSAIFDANALNKAVSDGWLEAVFIGTIPFVFMGLGYLIHMFQKTKKMITHVKLVALFVLTFMFDVILAYLIEKKIFDFERVLGESFSPTIAFESVNFWGIIFAGFVVYLIWGLVFDFVMKEYENVDKIKSFIRNKKAEIKNTEEKKSSLLIKIDEIKHEVTSIKGKISELQSKIDGFVFPVKEYLHYHYQYKEGWYQAINEVIALPSNTKDDLRNSCEDISLAHLRELKLENMDHQHVVFTTN